MANVLYISLTGMTEALGESQVVQYLVELAKRNSIYLLSFEKPTDLNKYEQIKNKLQAANIQWIYFKYSNRWGVISTAWQIFLSIILLSKIVRKHKIDLVHTRSLIPGVIGMLLKKFYKVKFLFDIRGFAIDEKIVDGRLKENSILTKCLKVIETKTYRQADHIVTLTHASKPIINDKYKIIEDKITVIPTCANNELFAPITQKEKIDLKKTMGFAEDDIIFLHSGSLNNWIDFEAELKLFEQLALLNNKIKFLFINKDQHELIGKYLEKYKFDNMGYKILAANFTQMKEYLNLADIGVFFVKPSFAKQASAPTKFAEFVACNLLSLTNTRYGDMEYYLNQYEVGMLLDLEKVHHDSAQVAKNVLNYLLVNTRGDNRTKLDFDRCFSQHFSKQLAVERYQNIYNYLCEDRNGV